MLIFANAQGLTMRSDQVDLIQFLGATYWDKYLMLSGRHLFPISDIVVMGIVSVVGNRHHWLWEVGADDFTVADMFQAPGEMCVVQGRLPFAATGDFNPSRFLPRRYYFYLFYFFYFIQIGGGRGNFKK